MRHDQTGGAIVKRAFKSKVLPLALTAALALILLAPGCRKKEEAPYGPGGAWIGDMRERIEDKIDDKAKSVELLKIVDKIEVMVTDMDQQTRHLYGKLDKLDADYNTTRDQIQDEFDKFNKARLEKVDKLTDIILEMKQVAGREDWKEISDIDKTLYQSWQRSPGFGGSK
jgi:hypothetical protein